MPVGKVILVLTFRTITGVEKENQVFSVCNSICGINVRIIKEEGMSYRLRGVDDMISRLKELTDDGEKWKTIYVAGGSIC